MKSWGKKLRAKAVLMDLDGTVVDSRAAYLEAVRTAFSRFGHLTFPVSAVLEIPKRLEQGKTIDDLVQGVEVESFLDVYLRTFYDVTRVKSKPFLKIDEALAKLHARAKLALVTMRCVPKDRVIDELKEFRLDTYFDLVVTAFDGCQPKPSPDAFVKSARELNIDVSECVVVGDSIVDVQAGRSAGAKTVGVLSGIYSREELQAEKPDLILENVRLLPDFVNLASK